MRLKIKEMENNQPTPPPWDERVYECTELDITKKGATENLLQARLLLQEELNTLPPQTVIAYTDGSAKDETYTCAVFIPEINQREDYPSMVVVCTDSKSCVQYLSNLPYRDMDSTSLEIWNLTKCLKNSGCKTKIIWIPSHCGIKGNEFVDQLAKQALTDPGVERIQSLPRIETLHCSKH